MTDKPAADQPDEAEILPPKTASVEQMASLGTEALLDALIEECRHLVREVALPSMCATSDPLDRMRFMETAVSLVKAGAEVGNTVARLRAGTPGTRHWVVVEHSPQFARLGAVAGEEGEGGANS